MFGKLIKDIHEVGRMYHFKFMDGYETDAFEDELY